MPKTKPPQKPGVTHTRVRRGNEEDAQAMREQLLRVAHDLYQHGGLKAVTMREVAARCGVAIMTPYRYYANKSELLSGLWQSVVGELLARQQAAVALAADPRGRLYANIDAFLQFWDDHPEHYRLVYMPEVQSESVMRAAVGRAPAFTQIWEYSRELTHAFALSIGGDAQKIPVAVQMRHYLVLGFVHANLVMQRRREDVAAMRPLVVEQAIEMTARYLLA